MVEAKSCTGGLTSIYYNLHINIGEIKTLFPNIKVVETMNQLTNPNGVGVYALQERGSIKVRIFGGCPNFQNGQCKLKNECITPTQNTINGDL